MEPRKLGPYRLLAELGSGGMGKVYRAQVVGEVPGLAPGLTVALKVVHPHLLEAPGFFKRFLREAEVGRTIRHENVVRTYDCDALVEDGVQQHFLVMEYVEGQTLRGLLQELDRVPEELCRHVGREVAKGLAAIHAAGVVHRDLKPENVLITKEHVVKVMDLGVARLAGEALRLSQTGVFVGSVQYAAPEQLASGGNEVDGRADLHALGLILYELSTGQHPYKADEVGQVMRRVLEEAPRRPAEINPQLSPFFEELVLCLLAKEREGRLQSAADLARVLEEGEGSEWWRSRAKAIRLATRRPLRRIRIPRETALVGRDAELTALRALYDAVRAGEGRVVLVEGEAGIGKSRLVDEFVAGLVQSGENLNFLYGSYPPGGAATASGAFSTAYREHFGAEGLEETLARYLVATPILVPAFAALLRGETTPTGVEPLTKDSLQTVFVHATQALAAERPTIVLIDDIHFAPEEGRALFASLALATPGHRILLVGTSRPPLDGTWVSNLGRHGHVARLVLGRLGAKDLVRLLKDALRSEALARELAGQIAEKSDGNPFFMFEILRGLREERFLARKDDGTWVTTRAIREIRVPSTVQDLVQARIADLDDDDRALLEVAACQGFEFDALLAGDVVGLARIPLLKTLGRIEKAHRLIRAVGTRYAFDHHQVQEALYAGLSPLVRQQYHAALAQAIEARSAAAAKDPDEIDGGLCVDLAGHFLAGGEGERARRYLDAALRHLEKGYLNDAAIALTDRALAEPGLVAGRARVALLLRKAGRLDLLGRRDAQRAALDEALALADAGGDPGLRARVRLSLGGHLADIPRNDEAMVRLREALDLARAAGDRRTEAGATGCLGVVFYVLGRLSEAREHHERHLALAQEIGDRRLEAGATVNVGNVFAGLGRYAEARERYERALALAREIGDRREEANATGNLGTTLMSLGRYAEAKEHFERHLALAREIGDRLGQAAATANLGTLLFSLGRQAEALELGERALAIAREIGDRQGEAIAMAHLGNVLCALGRYAEAREYYERNLSLHQEIGDRPIEARASGTGNLGLVFCWLGRHAEARAHVERAIALARETGDRSQEGHWLEGRALVADEEGRTADAETAYREAIALWDALHAAVEAAGSRAALGALLARLGRGEEARPLLEAAVAAAREAGVHQTVALSLAHLASLPGGDAAAAEEALARGGETADGREVRLVLFRATGKRGHLVEAKRRLDELLARNPEHRASILQNVRVCREIAAAWAEPRGDARRVG